MTKINEKMLLIGSMAAALMPENMVYRLGREVARTIEKSPKKEKQFTQDDIERIRLAQNKRLRKQAKRLTNLSR